MTVNVYCTLTIGCSLYFESLQNQLWAQRCRHQLNFFSAVQSHQPENNAEVIIAVKNLVIIFICGRVDMTHWFTQN